MKFFNILNIVLQICVVILSIIACIINYEWEYLVICLYALGTLCTSINTHEDFINRKINN